MSSVQIVTALAERITRLFDDAGASQIERYSALDVARALVPVSQASAVITASELSVEPPPPGSAYAD
jgi:hypothetical protein